jgi:hypothetical protein
VCYKKIFSNISHDYQLSWPSEQTQGQPIRIEDSPLYLISISHFPCSENANQNSW